MIEKQAIYLFEAKGIQRYLFESGKLKDVIGASEMVYQLVRSDGQDLLSHILKALNISDDEIDGDVVFSRRASGTFMLSGPSGILSSLQQAWRLAVQLIVPGLEFSDRLQIFENDSYKETCEACFHAGSGVRENTIASVLPLANPFTSFVPRTGRGQVAIRKVGPSKEERLDPLDQIVQPQHKAFLRIRKTITEGVAKRFISESKLGQERAYIFPRNMEEEDAEDTADNPLFPFVGNNWIALVHADISGLGQVWRNISDHLPSQSFGQELFKISKVIEDAIIKAAQSATEDVLLGEAKPQDYSKDGKPDIKRFVIPARPLVLGGDDLTLIVRADLAIKYAEQVLTRIEEETRYAFSQIVEDYDWLKSADLPGYLSACAGVAFAKSHQPFAMANELAEDLCKYAKKDAKENRTKHFPSGISFHVISTSLQEKYTAIRNNELITPDKELLISHPYFLNTTDKLPKFESFDTLVKILAENKQGMGKLKSLKTELMGSKAVAKKVWSRWRKIFESTSGKATMKSIDQCLIDLGVENPTDLPFTTPKNGTKTDRKYMQTPLFDAIALVDLGHVKASQENQEAA